MTSNVELLPLPEEEWNVRYGYCAAAEPAYDRDLIARMLTEYNHGYIGQFSPVAVEHQIKLLREAENRDAEGVRTVRRCGHIDDTAQPGGAE